MINVAILVDGGFYTKRAKFLWGEKPPEERAKELFTYCCKHLSPLEDHEQVSLYRIFYYDCQPSEKTIYHPLTQKSVYLKNSPTYKWNMDFQECLRSKRKVALRLGRISEVDLSYNIKPEATKKLCRKEITIDDLTEQDFLLNITQKGVDMKIGIDISSLAYKKQVNRIVLVAGDSDFVPAAKHARREGIDFILDPMRAHIKPELNEHIDGLKTYVSLKDSNKTRFLNY